MEIVPEPNITLKLEVAKYPVKERPQKQETAEILEEILQAASKGLDYLPPRANRAPGQIYNEAKKKMDEEKSSEQQSNQMKD